jgi:GT2 family glycosyltransferase
LGFAAGNNIGIQRASGDVVILLNNDTEVTNGWLWRSLKHLQNDSMLGLLGPSTDNCGNEARISLLRNDATWRRQILYRFSFRKLQRFQNKTVAFFCVFIKREVIEKVGLLDEAFGRGYFEDDDYCRRVEQEGYTVAISRDIFVHHEMGASFNEIEDESRKKLFEANRAVYEKKWGPWKPHKYSLDSDQLSRFDD